MRTNEILNIVATRFCEGCNRPASCIESCDIQEQCEYRDTYNALKESLGKVSRTNLRRILKDATK